MKLLIADGKVSAVSRGLRGQRSSRAGPSGNRETFRVTVRASTPEQQGATNPDGHLFGEEEFALDEESEDEDEEEALVSHAMPACLPAHAQHT